MNNDDGSSFAISDVDMTLLSFANWLTELRNQSQSTTSSVMAEMSVVRNGIQMNQIDLTEFKQQTANVQQQMQHNISDIKNELQRTFAALTQAGKGRSELEQKLTSDFQGLREILQYKQLEIDTLRKSYAESTAHLQAQVAHLTQELAETRIRLVEAKNRNVVLNEDFKQRLALVDEQVAILKAEQSHSKTSSAHRLNQLQQDTTAITSSVQRAQADINVWQKSVEEFQETMQRRIWELDHHPSASPSGISHIPPSPITTSQLPPQATVVLNAVTQQQPSPQAPNPVSSVPQQVGVSLMDHVAKDVVNITV